MVIDDRVMLAGLGTMFTAGCGAIAIMWRHIRHRERACDRKIRVLWRYIGILMGWPELPSDDPDDVFEPRLPRRRHDSKNHPARRRTDRVDLPDH